uniref:Uncharacterized protein n=1 Tax=Anguilla anguilla TaxID=7936 RepID=A0A0E9UDX5_ANGAN
MTLTMMPLHGLMALRSSIQTGNSKLLTWTLLPLTLASP